MNDVNILNAMNIKTENIAKALQQHGVHLSSFVSLTDRRIKNFVKGIKSNADYITMVATSFNSKLLNLENSFNNLFEILIYQATTLKTKFNKLEIAVESLLEEKFTIFLVQKHVLSQVIANIRQKLRKSYHKFYLLHLDASFYYSGAKFIYARHRNDLFITLKIPSSSQRLPLKLYLLITLPVPTSRNVRTTMKATQLLSLPKYFAITSHHDHFVTLTSEDLDSGVQENTILCKIYLAFTPITVPDCTMVLYANNIARIKELCNLRFLRNVLKSNIVELSFVMLTNQMQRTTFPKNMPSFL